MAAIAGAARTKSSLMDAKNDTGRVAFCGPYVLSALTGHPISHCEEAVNCFRGVTPDAPIKGTSGMEVAAALTSFGYEMTLKNDFHNLPRKERPTLWQWMQKPRNAWVHYLLAIHKGKEGHWILVKGVKMCDTFTEGQWTFVVDGPHRGCRIMEIFEIKKQIAFQQSGRPRTQSLARST